MNKLARLAELAAQLPYDLVADWRGTNHYELTSAHESGYFWLCIDDDASFVSSTTEGQRLGLLLDIAAEVSRLKREGVLSTRRPTVAEKIVEGIEDYGERITKGGE